MDRERWLTVVQAAELIEVQPETVHEWPRAGRWPGTLLRLRTGSRAGERDVERFLAGDVGGPVGKRARGLDEPDGRWAASGSAPRRGVNVA